MAKVVGIDLGTTNTVVAVLEGNRPEVIPNSEGGKTTPSVVFFDPSGDIIVGELAKRQRVTQPERTIYSVKRFMGCRWDEAQARSEGIAYKLVGDEEGMARVKIGNKKYRPEDISSHVLAKMKESAEAFLGQEIESAIVTVPAYFNDSQRTATKEAGQKAGLNVLRIINEPTAAALAYGLSKTGTREKVAVFDFGGGTFDISILDIESDIIEVKATCGDTYLGGDNINHLLVNWIVENIHIETGIDPAPDPQAMQRVVEVAEKVKCELSTLNSTVITLPFIVADATGPKHFNADLSRDTFTQMIMPILSRLRGPCEQALADAKVKQGQLTGVLLVGGSTRIPAVRKLVKEIFGREPDSSMNPDEVVAQGAAIQAGVMSGDLEEVLLLDVSPLSLGIELAGNVFSPLIPRNSNIPTTVTKRFTTVVDNQSTVKVHVLQGERRVASQNRSLAHFKLTGIPSAPREIPEIQVMFHIDANGIMTVSAMDLTSGSMQKIEIQSYATAGVDVEKVVAEAEASVEADKLFVQKAEIRRRLQVIEDEFKEMRERKNAEDVIDDAMDARMREAIFKWDIALAQDEWKLIEDAERNAKSVQGELNSMFSLKAGGSKAPAKPGAEMMMD